MKYDIAPRELKSDGTTYVLHVEQYNDKLFKGWWSYIYREKGKDSLPPEATDGKSIYYLCAMAPTKQEAEDDILERINTMKKIFTEKDKIEQKKLLDERMEKFKRK